MVALLSYFLLFSGFRSCVWSLSSALILPRLVYGGFEHGLYSYCLKKEHLCGGGTATLSAWHTTTTKVGDQKKHREPTYALFNDYSIWRLHRQILLTMIGASHKHTGSHVLRPRLQLIRSLRFILPAIIALSASIFLLLLSASIYPDSTRD